MSATLQTVKEFSPFGWGITVLVLVFQFVNERNANSVATKELEIRVLSLEKAVLQANSILSEIKLEQKQFRLLVCSDLKPSDRARLVSCTN